VGKMTKEEVVKFMLDSINKDNLEMCEKLNMSEEQIKKSMADSQQGLNLIATNLYDRMKQQNLIV
jgi:hypothetical protein